MSFFNLKEDFDKLRGNIKEDKFTKVETSQIDYLSGDDFEDYLMGLFKKIGYKVYRTKASGDFGADLILKSIVGTTVIQAKRYSSKVGLGAVQEVLASQNYYKAHSTLVITNNYYTEAAKQLADVNNVGLIDRYGLMKIIAEADKADIAEKSLSIMSSKKVERKKKDKLIMYILWFFTGLIGGHRYYLGDIGYAIGMTLTLGGLGIWTLIDVFNIGKRLETKNAQLEE